MQSHSAVDALLGVALRLRTKPVGTSLENSRATLKGLADALDAFGNSALSVDKSWDEIAGAIAALRVAAILRPAIKALGTASLLASGQQRAQQAMVALAGRTVARALSQADPLEAVSASLASAPESTLAPEPPIESNAPTQAELGVLDNIARYHREHERFYSVTLLEQAARLAREAAKLKVVADRWLQPAEAVPSYPGVDFSQPAYRAAGCDDLNALPGIASIGILFMEGQGEPAEIGILKATLGGSSAAAQQSGRWLAGMMAAAWERESAVLAWGEPQAAQARYRTIATNWIGAQETVMVGRLLALARDLLARIDSTPTAIRKNRPGSGEALLKAARVLGAAAQLQGQSGVDLATNDEPWTVYRAALGKLRVQQAGVG